MNLLKQDVKFGTKHSQHDNSIKTTQLSPEQTERLRNGEKYEDILTGEESVTIEPYQRQYVNVWKKDPININLTVEQYLNYRDQGMTDKSIVKELKVTANKLTRFKQLHGLI